MKKLGFLLVILSLIFGACPSLEDDDEDSADYGEEKTFDGQLDGYKWFEILDGIAKDGKFVSLDLTNCTYKNGNTNGGLVEDGGLIVFDPFPAVSSGKEYIVSITLPDITQVIDVISNADNITIENAKKYSAFRSFSNLRSVKADNVTKIGDFAFIYCTALTDVSFQRVTDIGKYTFSGCTSLKEIKFNLAEIISECAFKDCTGLSKMDFPVVNEIENNAFEGCASLVNVFFENVTRIHDEAFSGCTGLLKAEFNTAQKKDVSNTSPLTVLPIFGDENIPLDYSFIESEKSVIFYYSVFKGCKALEVLNVRNAWNVYFFPDVLANIGPTIDIYLFDVENSNDESFGHPQTANFLGEDEAVTVKKVNIFVPINNGKIQGNFTTDSGDDSIAKFIRGNEKYKDIDVNVNKR